MSARFLGIDPGVNGGIALIEDQHDGRQRVHVHKQPATLADLAAFLTAEAVGAVVVIERQEPRPTYWKDQKRALAELETPPCPTCGRGAAPLEHRSILKSTVLLFGGYMGTLGVLACMGDQLARVEDVRPQAWQQAMGIPRRSGKAGLKKRAQELFPGVKVTLWNADALLLAEFGRRTTRRA